MTIHRVLMQEPVATPGLPVQKTDIARVTVNMALRHSEQLGILRERTAQKRIRWCSPTRCVDIKNRGPEPPGR